MIILKVTKKSRFYPLFRRYIFRKTTGGGIKLIPSPAVLGLKYQLHTGIEETKENYYTKVSSRLVDPLISPKTYWSILKHS